MGLASFNRMRREQAAKAELEAKKKAKADETPKAEAKHLGGGKWNVTLADGTVLDQVFDKKTAAETVNELNAS